jgi:hypothetical protein
MGEEAKTKIDDISGGVCFIYGIRFKNNVVISIDGH